MKKTHTILIKFLGGPLDGGVKRLKHPYEPLLLIRSKFRSDVIHIYEYNSDPANHAEPFAYEFKGYKKDND